MPGSFDSPRHETAPTPERPARIGTERRASAPPARVRPPGGGVQDVAAPLEAIATAPSGSNSGRIQRRAAEHETTDIAPVVRPSRIQPRTDIIRRTGEREFNADPSRFMDTNQVLVALDEGVQATYSLSPDALAAIVTRQTQLSDAEKVKVNQRRRAAEEAKKVNPDDDYGLAVANEMKSKASIGRKRDNYLVQLMEAAMRAATCTKFSFAKRAVKSGMLPARMTGRNQYIVTPVLEALKPAIPETTMVPGPDGTPVSLKAALNALKRVQDYDAIINAAYIPYESNPGLMTDATKADVSTTGPIKVAFTAAMNGCSLAIKKKNDTELTVWHYPSPSSNAEEWKTFKADNDIAATYDWETYNGLSDVERHRLHRNHATTTVLIRDDKGWKVKSQQNVGPQGGDQKTAVLEIGKVYEQRLKVDEEVALDVVGGEAVVDVTH